MSAIGGIFNFFGKPVEARPLAALGAELNVLAPDGGSEVVAGAAGFTYRAFHTNRESRLVGQPLVGPRGHIVVFDGRLDNRQSLVSVLRNEAERLRDVPSDVEIVLAAFLKWGDDFPSRLIGDFALAVWDADSRKLILARDPVGVRTLYYHADSERIIWSSDLTSLLSVADVQLEIVDEYLAGTLAFGSELHLTPYKDVFAVSPGYMVSVSEGGSVSRPHRYWRLEEGKRISYRTDGEYEEHFRELFREAVAVRLRADGPVYSELSGGLDSSSVVCMADRVLERGVGAEALETVSYVSDSSPTSDERRFIAYVEEHRGKRSNYLFEEDYPYLRPYPDLERISTVNSALITCAYPMGVRDIMRSHGARVLLSGLGGDELLTSTNIPGPGLRDCLFDLRLRRLHDSLKEWSYLLKEPYVGLLWRQVVEPSLPLRLRSVFKRDEKVLSAPPWINPEFAERTHLRSKVLGPADPFGFRKPSERMQSVSLISVVSSIARGGQQEIGGFDVTYPFLHRPLVEFLQAIPFDQKLRPGESRSILRRSLEGILPEKTRQRRGKGNPSELIYRALAREAEWIRGLLSDARITRYGYADADAVREALDHTVRTFKAPSASITETLTLEVWLRLFEQRSQKVAGRRPVPDSRKFVGIPRGVRTA